MEKKVNLKRLFEEKKYSDIIFVIENKLSEAQKSSPILNLLGVCRLSKNDVTKDDFFLAIKDFKKSFLKEIGTKASVEGFRNFINASLKIFDTTIFIHNQKISIKNFEEITSLYDQYEKYLSKEESILVLLTRVYKRLNNLDKVRFYLKELINKKYYSQENICNYIYYNCFIDDWTQADFLKNTKLIENYLPIYPDNKLNPLNSIKNKKIRIGILSSDIFKEHSVTHFLKSVINNYSKKDFEVYLYLNNKKINNDKTTNYFVEKVDKSKNIFELTDIDTLNLIRNDRIDILIDMMGVTSVSRLQIAKNRAAPIQILWCGYCNTSGIKEMDYILTDRNLIYENEKKLYEEKVLYLPNIWNCHNGISLPRKFNKPPFIKNKMITFGSFNNFNKITDSVVKTWSEILKSVKNSKLILKSSSPIMSELLSSKFNKENILNSIELVSYSENFEDHLNLYNKIDIALDTFPYNGVTTSFEAAWMGVPVLTMKGYNFNSRCGESINKNLKLDYLIARSQDDYVYKAKEIINSSKLIQIRKQIFDNVLSSPLFDTKKFSKDFFDILESIYKKKFS